MTDAYLSAAFGPNIWFEWTPTEGINKRNLKIWADVADKYVLAVPKNLGVGVDFRPCSEGNFLSRRP